MRRAVYFALTGKFRKDATLLLYLSLGWLMAFLAMPVLGSTLLMEYGGLRLMPPRSDDWAGILGVFIAGSSGRAATAWRLCARDVAGLHSWRHFVRKRADDSLLPALSGTSMALPDGVPEAFAHYQSANWHSILEQMHGFGHGLAIAVAMAMLWRRQPYDAREGRVGGWTVAFSVFFAWFVVGFLNLYKLVETWVGNGAVPPTLKAPLLGFIEVSPLAWFCIVWWTAAAVGGVLLLMHQRRRLDIVPDTWTGKGQLIYVVFLWLMVIGNLARAIPGFSNGRMVTEWVLFMNASLATLLIVALPRKMQQVTTERDRQQRATTASRGHRSPRPGCVGLAAVTVLMCVYGYLTLAMYQPHLEGKPWANHRRFGPEAKWHIDPILKHGEHP